MKYAWSKVVKAYVTWFGFEFEFGNLEIQFEFDFFYEVWDEVWH